MTTPKNSFKIQLVIAESLLLIVILAINGFFILFTNHSTSFLTVAVSITILLTAIGSILYANYIRDFPLTRTWLSVFWGTVGTVAITQLVRFDIAAWINLPFWWTVAIVTVPELFWLITGGMMALSQEMKYRRETGRNNGLEDIFGK